MNNFYNDKDGRYPVQTVTIETVDQAVFDYFDKILSPSVFKQNTDIPYRVPIFFAAGERWALIRQNRFRDRHGTLILPIISIRRTNIDRTRREAGMAQETRSITISKNVHAKTSVIQNAVDARKRSGIFFQPKVPPIIETITIPFPDFCQVFYEVTIWAQYNTHMNEILEKIFYKYQHLDSFVMPVEYDGKHPKGNSYYFVGYRDGQIVKQSNDDNFTNQERIIKYLYNIRTPVYFMLDPKDEALSYGKDEEGQKIVYKKQSVNKIKLQEKVLTAEEFEKLYG